MMKAGIMIAAIILLSLLAGCSQQQPAAKASGTPQVKVVRITSAGFVPDSLTINAGDYIAFVNDDSNASNPHWVASGVHPVHTEYPQQGGCMGSLFDACADIPYGGNYTFQFNLTGEWHFHDHEHEEITGMVTVQ